MINNYGFCINLYYARNKSRGTDTIGIEEF